jgi:hypothetical protein
LNRALSLLILVFAAACSGASTKPGAMFRGPGALAVFDGVVAASGGTLRPFLAVGNERGDELRLVDLTDNRMVLSPGLVFPLSVPTAGRPMWVLSADLHDGKADALAVIAPGSGSVEIIDTWSGFPTVHASVALPAGAEVLAAAAAAVPVVGSPSEALGGSARLVIALTGGQLQIVELARTGDAVEATPGALSTLTFEVSSLSQGADLGVIFAGSLDPTVGVAGIALPGGAVLASCATPAPVKAVAAVSYGSWDPATWPADPAGALVERVIAAPLESDCGEGKSVRCGLLSVVPTFSAATPPVLTALALEPTWIPADKRVATDETHLIPLALPAPIDGLLATGRAATNLLPLVPGVGTGTTGLAVVAAADGGVYPIDLARWTLASSTTATTGDGRTRVSAASADAVNGSRIALWKLDKGLNRIASSLSSKSADLLDKARVRVTPGFTPDDAWTLTWQGVLPGLDTRGAVLGRDATGPWLAVQVDLGTGPTAVANLGALDVRPGDLVELGGYGSACPAGTRVEVLDVVTGVAGAAADAAHLRGLSGGALPACLASVPASGSTVEEVATFRAAGLVLTGERHGYAGRVPHTNTTADVPGIVTGRRLFHVYDGCADGSECATRWRDGTIYDLAFPFPTGATVGATTLDTGETPALVLGLAAGFVTVDAAGVQTVTAVPPVQGTALRFTTKSGLVAAARRPIIDGTPVASTLPTGIALRDPVTGAVSVHVSYTAGLVMLFNTGEAADKVAVLR